MEDEKFHNQLSINWRTKKAGDTIQHKDEGLRTRSDNVQGQKMDDPAQRSETEREQIPISSAFIFHWGFQQTV